jgi:hypothetical protein
MLDDVGSLAYADELRIMRPFHLRCRDADEPLHHDVARQRGIPIGAEEALSADLAAKERRDRKESEEHDVQETWRESRFKR